MQSDREHAETIALQALAWIVADEGLLSAFLGASGLAASDLRGRAGEAEVLASVLDFLLSDDRWVMGFCDACGLGYDRPRRARAALPGAPTDDWT